MWVDLFGWEPMHHLVMKIPTVFIMEQTNNKAVFKIEDGEEQLFAGFKPTRQDVIKRDPWKLSLEAIL